MKIENMFAEDINRKINGVVKVDQSTDEVLIQELNEYIITKELKSHFITFFNNYIETFDKNTDEIGVWISGFFGSGKSHFLKMLSYLLENKTVHGTKTVERFRKKFEDDPATFMLIDRATSNETDTILFNIDIEGSINKDKTAVLRVFAKMFYNYLGFYGEDLKIAKLEQFVEKKGKTEEFRRIFEENNGSSWLESRDSFAFHEDEVVATLQKVLGMSEQAASNWFNGTAEVETSIAQLVSEIKEYVDSKPDNFRLLFMADEVGQYVGGDTDLLINLQSLVEKIGSECRGKVWVVCTGQEAIDEIIKARENEFSRIQARFATRLSLSSSSADEVIQKRILLKKPDVKPQLEQVYNTNQSVLRNLFKFSDSVSDIRGFNTTGEFVRNFPFVPYQFILLQKVFAEIRKHGNSGKHLSGGERSMLSGFQEAAQKLQGKDEYVLAPFSLFYNTVHSFLDSSIRRVIERCQRAADEGAGIEQYDVEILKLLYLVRYVDDVKANIENIVILMADDIRMDKVTAREQVRDSLDRLLRENYIGRTGDTYNFLTDQEQDIQRDIKNTTVATGELINHIAQLIFADIYTSKKYRYDKNDFKYDFPIDAYVDNAPVGSITGGMNLCLLTVATPAEEKIAMNVSTQSMGKAIVVLAENPYYETLENAAKIRKYVKQRNISQLPADVQSIIRARQEEAGRYEREAFDSLKKAIEGAEFYVDGEHIEIKSGDAKGKIDQALEYLVSHVYRELDCIEKNYDSDADVINILKGDEIREEDTEPNLGAASKIAEYLHTQNLAHLPTTMADVQSKFQTKPYGWREIDIAAVVAILIKQQKVTIKYGGATVQPTDTKLPDMLRKKSETGKTSISERQVVNAHKMKLCREFLREYFDTMDIPTGEDELVAFIIERFTKQKEHLNELLGKYRSDRNYPDKDKVNNSIDLVDKVLSQKKDNTALISYIADHSDDLLNDHDDMHDVEGFFDTQVTIYDSAVELEIKLRSERHYLTAKPDAEKALNNIRLIITNKNFSYSKIPELNRLMAVVNSGHSELLDEKRREIGEMITQCMGTVHQAGQDDVKVKDLITKADDYFGYMRDELKKADSLAILDSYISQIAQKKDDSVTLIEEQLRPAPVTPEPQKKSKNIKTLNKQIVFPSKVLESEEDIDKYVDKLREQLKTLIKGCDGISLK